MGMINNLGTRLFKSVTDKAGDLGDKFADEFALLSRNITAEVDLVVQEVLSLSVFIKVTLVLLCVLIVVVILRYLAFGWRVAFFKFRDWVLANENKQPPQVILLMPQKEDGEVDGDELPPSPPSPAKAPLPLRRQSPRQSSQSRRSMKDRNSIMYTDPITAQNIANLKKESMTLFHNPNKIVESV